MDPSADGQYCGHIRLFAFAASIPRFSKATLPNSARKRCGKRTFLLAPGAACLGKSAPAQIGRAS